MKSLYRHYRQVEISSRSGEKPEVQGYEEIWHNGQKQVRHWTEKDDLNSLPIEIFDPWDLWNDPWGGFNFPMIEPDERKEFESFHSSPRYINPIEVEVEAPVKRKFILGEQLSKIKQLFTRSWQKVQTICQRLPSALKAAWRELNVGATVPNRERSGLGKDSTTNVIYLPPDFLCTLLVFR